MTINFIIPNTIHYQYVLHTMIDPIAEHLQDYIISNKSKDNCLNVHFFNEYDYFPQVGGIGSKSAFCSHGCADKNWRNYSKIQQFDYIIVSGPAWYDKMISQGCPKEKLIIGGYPKLDLMWGKQPQPHDKKIILWSPTHNMIPDFKYHLSTYPFFNDYVSQIPSEYEFKISLHPANRKDKSSTIDDMCNADFIVSGTSSALYEAWALGKPLIFPDFIIKESVLKMYPNSFEDYIYRNQIGYHAKDMPHFVELLKEAEVNGMKKEAIEFMEGIFPTNLRGCSGETIAKYLKEIN